MELSPSYLVSFHQVFRLKLNFHLFISQMCAEWRVHLIPAEFTTRLFTYFVNRNINGAHRHAILSIILLLFLSWFLATHLSIFCTHTFITRNQSQRKLCQVLQKKLANSFVL
jgi:hypothetical protein